MILKGIKLALAKNKIGKHSTKDSPLKFMMPVSSIGIILDAESIEFLPKFIDLKEKFLLKDSDFKIVLFKNKDENASDFDGLTFAEKDLNIIGNFRNLELIKFAANRMDLLITFAEENNIPVNLLTHSCNANLKVGRHLKNEHFLDLIIKSDDDAELFISELLKCLKQFKAN